MSIAPNAVEPKLALANYYWATSRVKQAEAQLEAAIQLDAKNVTAHRAMAIQQLSTRRPQEAEAHLKAVVANTTDAGSRLSLADFYLSQNRPDAASPLLEDLVKREEAFAAATSRLAGVTYRRGERERAHQMLDSVLAKEPSNVAVMFVKGNWHIQEGKIEEALKTAEAALKAAPDSIQAHQLAGNVRVAKARRMRPLRSSKRY